MQEGSDNDSSDSDSDDGPEEQSGTDMLQSSKRFDIPICTDIPILSQLAREDKKNNEKKVDKKQHDKFAKRATQDVMDADDLEIDTHFVENPFIKTRERANEK